MIGYAGRHEHVPVQRNVSSCDFAHNANSFVGVLSIPPRSRSESRDYNMQTNDVFGVNTLPPLCAALVIASLTWSKP